MSKAGVEGLLDAETLALVEQLRITAQKNATSALAGLHPTARRGSSVEFAEHKEYAPGDDLRRIDWRAYGRVDRYYLKQYEDEANLRLFLVVDRSGSMAYGNKFDYARQLAAALAQLALSQRDAAGLMLAGHDWSLLPPRTRLSHLTELCHRLVVAEPEGEGRMASALTYLAEAAHGRGVCIVISDMLERSTDLVAHLAHFAARGFDVRVVQVQHPDERDFPFTMPSQFVSMETPGRVFIQPRLVRERYKETMARYCNDLGARLSENRIHYLRCDSSRPVSEALLRLLQSASGKGFARQ